MASNKNKAKIAIIVGIALLGIILVMRKRKPKVTGAATTGGGESTSGGGGGGAPEMRGMPTAVTTPDGTTIVTNPSGGTTIIPPTTAVIAPITPYWNRPRPPKPTTTQQTSGSTLPTTSAPTTPTTPTMSSSTITTPTTSTTAPTTPTSISSPTTTTTTTTPISTVPLPSTTETKAFDGYQFNGNENFLDDYIVNKNAKTYLLTKSGMVIPETAVLTRGTYLKGKLLTIKNKNRFKQDVATQIVFIPQGNFAVLRSDVKHVQPQYDALNFDGQKYPFAPNVAGWD